MRKQTGTPMTSAQLRKAWKEDRDMGWENAQHWTETRGKAEYATAAVASNLCCATAAHGGGVVAQRNFCRHTGLSTIFSIGLTKICGAAEYDLLDADSAALVVNLTGRHKQQNLIHTPKAYAALRRYALQSAAQITIDWPDRGSPPLVMPFWPKLVELLPKGRVVFYCYGGHGRTGTALASLGIVGMGWPAHVAIAKVRALHCKDAIETLIQMNYLKDLAVWWRANQSRFPAALARIEEKVKS